MKTLALLLGIGCCAQAAAESDWSFYVEDQASIIEQFEARHLWSSAMLELFGPAPEYSQAEAEAMGFLSLAAITGLMDCHEQFKLGVEVGLADEQMSQLNQAFGTQEQVTEMRVANFEYSVGFEDAGY